MYILFFSFRLFCTAHCTLDLDQVNAPLKCPLLLLPFVIVLAIVVAVIIAVRYYY